MNNVELLDGLRKARPLLRSIVAFLIYLRFGSREKDLTEHQMADGWLNKLETDLRKER